MKIFSFKLLATTVCLSILLSANIAFATELKSVIPSNSLFYVEIDASQQQPMKGKLSEFINKAFENSESSELVALLANEVETAKFGFATTKNESTKKGIAYLAISLSQSTFDELMKNADSSTYQIIKTGNQSLYQINEDTFFAFKNGIFFASNVQGIVSDFLLTDTYANSIQQNINYVDFEKNIIDKSFMNLFINIQKIKEALPTSDSTSTFDYFDYLGLSLKQSTSGIEGAIIGKINNPDITASYKNFTPSIYKSINSSGMILFFESNDLKNKLNKALSSDPTTANDYETAKTEFNTSTGIDFDGDLLALTQKNYSISVRSDAKQMLPSFTLISGTDNSTLAKASSKKIIDAIEKAVRASTEDEYQFQMKYGLHNETVIPADQKLSEGLSRNTTDNFESITIDSAKLSYYQGAEMGTASDLFGKFTVSAGYQNGNFIITTDLTPENLLGTNPLNENSEWKKHFTTIPSSITDLAFIDFQNFHQYFLDLIEKNDSSMSVEEINTFFKPLYSVSFSTSLTSDTLVQRFQLNFETSAIEAFINSIIENIAIAKNYEATISKELTLPPLNFSDVNDEDWFKEFVDRMSSKRIMTGYEDKTFKPNQPITRAEFVKILLVMGQNTDLFEFRTQFINSNSSWVSDVPYSAWYYSYVYDAYNSGLVTGYSDGTFKPNQPINRAEAASILGALSGYQSSTLKSTPFTDISENAWYYSGVNKLYQNKIVNGKTSTAFDPAGNLTRAEAAKMFYLYFSSL